MAQNGAVENAGLHMIMDIYIYLFQHTKTKLEYTWSGSRQYIKQTKNKYYRYAKTMKY